MCGITGIIRDSGKKVHPEILKKMTDALMHRGPDEEGFFIDKEIGLGIRRLSIIDILSGKQPQSSKDGKFHIVFNGEIYNFKDVRLQLEQKGYKFRTHSDTEVILAAFIIYGSDCLALFNGMFSFAIWNRTDKELFLARDRLGVKPLYYTLIQDGTFLFASEIKALKKYPGWKPEINPSALNYMFTYGFGLAPETFFKNVFQVLPGHYLRVTLETVTQHKYWDLPYDKPKLNQSSKEISENLFFHLKEAVKSRLVSDVPVSAYLSGGIDSSCVSGLYSRLENSRIKTFSIGFPYKDYNELPFSDTVSDFFQTEHSSFMCHPETEDFRKLIWHLESPMVTLLNLPLYYLSRTVHEAGFKVVLSGDGADELLGGYHYFKLFKLFHFIKRLPQSSLRIKLLKRLMPHLNSDSELEKYFHFLKLQAGKAPLVCPHIPYLFNIAIDKNQLFSNDYNNEIQSCTNLILCFDPEILSDMHPMDQVFYLETKFRLLNLTLPLSDKMSMANSVENRSPFLDYKVAEFCTQIPHHLKIRALNEKFILKKAMRNFLPPSIIQRTKQPLTAPARWFMELIGEPARYYLSEKIVLEKNYFNPHFVHFAKEHEKNNSANDSFSGILLMIFFVHLWDDLFLKS